MKVLTEKSRWQNVDALLERGYCSSRREADRQRGEKRIEYRLMKVWLAKAERQARGKSYCREARQRGEKRMTSK